MLIASLCGVEPPLNCSNHLSLKNTILVLHELPMNNNHQSTTAATLGSRGWSLYTGLTVQLSIVICGLFICDFAYKRSKKVYQTIRYAYFPSLIRGFSMEIGVKF